MHGNILDLKSALYSVFNLTKKACAAKDLRFWREKKLLE